MSMGPNNFNSCPHPVIKSESTYQAMSDRIGAENFKIGQKFVVLPGKPADYLFLIKESSDKRSSVLPDMKEEPTADIDCKNIVGSYSSIGPLPCMDESTARPPADFNGEDGPVHIARYPADKNISVVFGYGDKIIRF